MEQTTEQQLREKYGEFYTLTVQDSNNKDIITYLRKLDRTTYKVISKLMEKDELMAVESLLNSLYIGGDDPKLIINDFDALRSAEVTLVDMIRPKHGTLKKN
jgi:hypothetical protein